MAKQPKKPKPAPAKKPAVKKPARRKAKSRIVNRTGDPGGLAWGPPRDFRSDDKEDHRFPWNGAASLALHTRLALLEETHSAGASQAPPPATPRFLPATQLLPQPRPPQFRRSLDNNLKQ